MALSFVAGSWQLVNWGFSTGDIAIAVGAGRAVGNWIMSERRDQALIDFMALDTDALLSRRGLVDTVSLHQRWDQKIRLLKNNKPHVISLPGEGSHTVIANMGRFTWIMTLIVAALDAAMNTNTLHDIVLKFLEVMFQESPVGVEYLQCEATQHIQGWRSSACVRGLLSKAIHVWGALEKNGKHLPGKVPHEEQHDVRRLLLWLVTEKTWTFSTTSSDVFSIAAILQELGMEIVLTEDPDDLDDHRTQVLFHAGIAAQQWEKSNTQTRENKLSSRFGMRIPLDSMQECVSLWPKELGASHVLRQMFEDGMHAVEADALRFQFDPKDSRYLMIVSETQSTRHGDLEHRIATRFIPTEIVTRTTIKYLSGVVGTWPEDAKAQFKSWIGQPELNFPVLIASDVLPKPHLAAFQAFLMGFYYKLVLPLVDSSQLLTQEVLGSWTFNDGNLFSSIGNFVKSGSSREDLDDATRRNKRLVFTAAYSQQRVLALIAYLFLGAEPMVVERIAVSSHASQVTGVCATLSAISKAGLGSAGDTEECGRYSLLDVDTSCIPCNSRGIVIDGTTQPTAGHRIVKGESKPLELDDSNFTQAREDFTAHIEPDWDNDLQSSLVAFRNRGRLVFRSCASNIAKSIEALDRRPELPKRTTRTETGHLVWDQRSAQTMAVVPIDQYNVGYANPLLIEGDDVAMIVTTVNQPVARACILAMYELGSQEQDDIAFIRVKNRQELEHAVDQGWRYVLLTE